MSPPPSGSITGHVTLGDSRLPARMAPVSESVVSLLRKENSGKWTTCDMPSFSSTTDDLGSFRLSGLPPGEYLLRTTLALHGNRVSSAGANDGADPDYRWDVYFGDGVRPKDAKTIVVKDGEESDGNELRIPLAMLHPVVGVVLNSETGAPIHEQRSSFIMPMTTRPTRKPASTATAASAFLTLRKANTPSKSGTPRIPPPERSLAKTSPP